MIIAASIIVLICMGWAATAMFGKPTTGSGLAAQAALAVPFIAISCGVGLAYGMGLVGAIVASASVLIALLLPALMPAQRIGDTAHAGRAAVTWASGTIVLICLGALLLSWTASMIQFASPLNRTVVVIVIGISACLAGIGRNTTRAWSRVFVIGSIVAALLFVVASVFVGAPSTVTSPALNTNNDGILPGILFAVALVIVGAAHPGIRATAARDRRGLVLAAVVMALVTLATLIAMLALSGGWITKASFPMFVILAFMPPAIAYLFIAAMTLLGMAGLRRIVSDTVVFDPATQKLIFARSGGISDRSCWIVITIVTVLIIVLAITPVPQKLVAVVAAVFAVISLFANRVLFADAPSSTPAEEAATVEASG